MHIKAEHKNATHRVSMSWQRLSMEALENSILEEAADSLARSGIGDPKIRSRRLLGAQV
jgi:hypothetical protein